MDQVTQKRSRMMIKICVLVVAVVVVLVGWGPQALAQEWKTYYSPEKRFSIDYLSNTTSPTNITETTDQVEILSNSIGIKVAISSDPQIKNPDVIDLKEKTVYIQNAFQEQGEGIKETTNPIILTDTVGYTFTLDSPDPKDGTSLLSKFIYANHKENSYQFMIYESNTHAFFYPEQVESIANSIKFFN